MKPQLLCTFAHRNDLSIIIDYVTDSYTIPENRLFVFNNSDTLDDLYITFNIEPGAARRTSNTISIHRKKETNTLYTVNALNAVVKSCNNGVLDKSFIIDWNRYKNSLLLTAEDELRHIRLDFYRRVNL